MEKEQPLYYPYSVYLKNKYGEKVYKLPINLPITCPNRLDGKRGCSFCAECGTGFEAQDAALSVADQLTLNKERIARKYKANKFIAYFQNYTNTFLPVEDFKAYILEACNYPDIVEIAISTRPDCVREEYLAFLNGVSKKYHVGITLELGLQTVNYHTLSKIDRGHTLAEYIDAAIRIKKYGFELCTHVILNLPDDTIADAVETAKILSALSNDCVKVHSLYIVKNTRLCEQYENGTIALCSKEEYFRRVITFLEHLDPSIAIERLFSRVPEEDAVFCNWQTSWWKLKDELELEMRKGGHFQGQYFGYLNGSALEKL
ncbi:MAG: TIGR01212 family radical SAM protein [Lachnospiraceae bacterium]|nr:TIGR01212 family radical SAM protein [Lachnospiraceae bacterium]